MIVTNPIFDNFNFKNGDYVPILKYRQERLNWIRKNEKNLAKATRHYSSTGAQGYYDFICDWFFTLDPRRGKNGSLIPFILFPKQVELLEFIHSNIENGEGGIVEKSRDTGVSYLFIAYAVCVWCFEKGTLMTFSSYKEIFIDSMGSPNSLLEKARIIIRNLPWEFRPMHLKGKGLKHYNEGSDARFMNIINRENDCNIIGESGTDVGRAGRSRFTVIDESAHLIKPLKTDAALTGNAEVVFHCSSVNGPPGMNVFASKRFSGEWPVFVFDWRDDPRKDEEWYRKKESKYKHAPHLMKQEYDRDYNASVEGVTIPRFWVDAAILAHKDPEMGWNLFGDKVVGMDVADEGEDFNAISYMHGNILTDIEQWPYGSTTENGRLSYTKAELWGSDYFKYDSVGVGAGVKGAIKDLRKNKNSLMTVMPVNTGINSLPGIFIAGKTNQDMFVNAKAMFWWKLRIRFQNTYERIVMENKNISHTECISIPDNTKLCTELSSPKWFVTETGKIQIESKKDMRKRGIPSTNLADSLIIATATKVGKQVGTV